MTEFISNLIGNDYLATVIMSFVPLIELKGGIVFAVSETVNISYPVAFLLAYLGSTLVFFPIYFLLRPFLNFLKKLKWFEGFANKVESYFEQKADKTLQDQKDKQTDKKPMSETLIKQLGVFIFVAIPLPMTGIWTGTAIAVFLNLKFKDAVLPVVLGNMVAGLLICLLSFVCSVLGISLDIVLYVLFGLAIILLIVFIIKVNCSKQKTENKE